MRLRAHGPCSQGEPKVHQVKLSEADVTKQIVDFLRAHRWRVVRQQSGLFRSPTSNARVRIGETGMCDWYAYRPVKMNHSNGLVQFFELEIKAPGKRPSMSQEAYMAARQWVGTEADWFDCFDRNNTKHEGERPFVLWYTERFE